MFKKTYSALLSLTAATAILASTAVTASAAAAPDGGTAGVSRVQAQAQPQTAAAYSVINWDITGITNGAGEHAGRYWNLIDAIHRSSYGDSTEVGGGLVEQTTRNTNRLIQVRVLNEGADLVSVYLWADNLYVAGFYSPAPTGTGPSRTAARGSSSRTWA